MEKKTVVITGSARGLGYEMAKCFRRKNFNVVISDVLKKDVDSAKKELLIEKGNGEVIGVVCDITKCKDIANLVSETKKKFVRIDFWINNAGINQPDKLIWEMDDEEISKIIDVDLKGTIMVSRYIMEVMEKQGYGSIYNVEGHGSNDAIIPGISIYGTAKRGVTYFTKSLAKEAESSKLDIIVGLLSPGIMITDFLVNAFRNKKIKLTDKNKRVYNTFGDYPDVVAKYLVNRMVSNTNNGVRITWLTKRKAFFKLISSILMKEKRIK